MRMTQIMGILFLITAFAFSTTLTGCSNKDKEKKDSVAKVDDKKSGEAEKGKSEEKQPAKAETITAKTDAVIKGFVKFDGPTPTPVEIAAMKAHADGKVCLDGSESEKIEQLWLINKDNGVANVIVSLKAIGGKFNITDELKAPFKKAATIDQPHCAFVPHVVALYPDAGQELIVKNSAPVPHNTNMTGDPLKNPNRVFTIAPGKEEPAIALKHQSTPISVVCNLHSWMGAKIVTFNHPYFCVTKEDGSFEIPNVPSGVELEVIVWHESMTGKGEVQKQTFKSGDNSLELKVKAK